MFLKELKEYIFSLRNLILFASFVFVAAIFLGYFLAKDLPEEMRIVFRPVEDLEDLEEMLEPVEEMLELLAEMPPLVQFLVVFLNNSLTAFLAIVLGVIFGIFPFLVLVLNGLLVGVVVYFAQMVKDWWTILALILPHGIIEVPAVILACATGFKLSKIVFERILGKEVNIKAELKLALIFFFKFLLPLLAIAAAIEIFLVARLFL